LDQKKNEEFSILPLNDFKYLVAYIVEIGNADDNERYLLLEQIRNEVHLAAKEGQIKLYSHKTRLPLNKADITASSCLFMKAVDFFSWARKVGYSITEDAKSAMKSSKSKSKKLKTRANQDNLDDLINRIEGLVISKKARMTLPRIFKIIDLVLRGKMSAKILRKRVLAGWFQLKFKDKSPDDLTEVKEIVETFKLFEVKMDGGFEDDYFEPKSKFLEKLSKKLVR